MTPKSRSKLGGRFDLLDFSCIGGRVRKQESEAWGAVAFYLK